MITMDVRKGKYQTFNLIASLNSFQHQMCAPKRFVSQKNIFLHNVNETLKSVVALLDVGSRFNSR